MNTAPLKHQRGRLVAILATIALFVSLVLIVSAQAQRASATSVSPDLPTINLTLPAGVSQSALDGSKDTVRTGTKISTEDPSGPDLPPVIGEVGLPPDGVVGEVKPRGNYTYTLAKKPYQIKLDKKRPLFGMPAAKTWILLANYADMSLMRNKLAYDLGASLGLHGSPDSRWVDLKINGQYRGNYLITEKVEVKTNRVDLTDPQGILVELDHRGDGSQPATPPRTTGSTAPRATRPSCSRTPSRALRPSSATGTRASRPRPPRPAGTP
jgi:hypothetical protein